MDIGDEASYGMFDKGGSELREPLVGEALPLMSGRAGSTGGGEDEDDADRPVNTLTADGLPFPNVEEGLGFSLRIDRSAKQELCHIYELT